MPEGRKKVSVYTTGAVLEQLNLVKKISTRDPQSRAASSEQIEQVTLCLSPRVRD